jgi:hypothetical protein
MKSNPHHLKIKHQSCSFSVLALGLILATSALADHPTDHSDDNCPNGPRVMEAAHQLDLTADRFHEVVHVITGSNALANAAHELAEAAEHLHQLIEQGVDCDHIRSDFEEINSAFRRVRNEWHYAPYFVRSQPQTRAAFRNMEHAYYDLESAINSVNPSPWPNPVPNPGREIFVRCKSSSYNERVCPVGLPGTVLDVNVMSQKSHSPCDKSPMRFRNASFGITLDRSSIWVNQGCEAIFSVRVRN